MIRIERITESSTLAPVELNQIPDLHHLFISQLAAPPGIYFLYKGVDIKYVGKANNVVTRVLQHHGVKDFDRVYFLPCPLDHLSNVESVFIRYLNPPLNRSIPKNLKQKDLDLIKSVMGIDMTLGVFIRKTDTQC